MLSKSILTGLFVLKNNRTIKQKVFRVGRKGNCPYTLFFRQLREAQGNGVVFRQWVTRILVKLDIGGDR